MIQANFKILILNGKFSIATISIRNRNRNYIQHDRSL